MPSQPSRQSAARPAPAGAEDELHPRVRAAAEGALPEWAVAGERRRAHVERVAGLLGDWAAALGLPERERARWRGAGLLHDALRDERPERLRSCLTGELVELPPALLHGPAAAARLRSEGVDDEELLAAVAFHTLGDASFGALGRALFCADFLDPGRAFLPEWRAELRARMPGDLDDVVREVARARIGDLLERGLPVHPRTVAFWNALVSGGAGGAA